MKKLICVLAVLACVVCGCSRSRSSDEPVPPVTLTVGHVGHDHQIALGVAAIEGERLAARAGAYLREIKAREVYDLYEGEVLLARLRIRQVKGGSAMPAAMEAGQIDIGLGGVAAVAKFVDKGQPFRIIAPLHTDGDFLVVGSEMAASDWDAFIAAVRASDKPVRIGYKSPVAVAKLIFVRALAAEGVSWSEGVAEEGVDVVMGNCHGGKNSLPTLAAGEIDGFVMNQPQPAIAEIKELGTVIADLRMLPPAGRWDHHPCCCVATSEGVLTEHAGAVKALLKVLAAATELIAEDTDLAVGHATAWTRTDPAVEQASVPGIVYLAEPTEEYMTGLATWATLMAEEGQFTDNLVGLTAEQVVGRIADMTLCRQALAELREAGGE